MRREEDAVFPLLQQHLCVAEQRAMVRTYWQTQMICVDNPTACRIVAIKLVCMESSGVRCSSQQMHSASFFQVWRTLRAMPLRLLERVMPWLAAKLPEPDIEEMLATVR